MAKFGLTEYSAKQGRIIIAHPGFDFDEFSAVAYQFILALSAAVVEKQCDADIHSWLIDFEGCRLILKGEHYSESFWIEALDISASQEEMKFIAGLLERGF
ncbi:DUF3630 family protein [Vibrio hippocampi]|uniref:Aminopeptidase n=1 Tax=Vibrio hippocampi TaxID=654686 RepID=A0ABN8DES5_9VIBR|nr:DUF3630 family protein [Vibrio hippocampi]CAH0524220.1 hypothetical protein VHP8226_00012 [Vibrio hippocampi]